VEVTSTPQYVFMARCSIKNMFVLSTAVRYKHRGPQSERLGLTTRALHRQRRISGRLLGRGAASYEGCRPWVVASCSSETPGVPDGHIASIFRLQTKQEISRIRRYVLPKRRAPSELHGVTTKKTAAFTNTHVPSGT
jgi:hypothetical protein